MYLFAIGLIPYPKKGPVASIIKVVMEKQTLAFALFDDFNKQDPRQFVWEGTPYPTEYFLALKLYDWIVKLSSHAPEILLLASRCQHIGRWKIPRGDYPMGKTGYFRWRKDLAQFHAGKAGELMEQAGYNAAEIKAVQMIIRKEHIRTQSETQLMEDALCLVFLQYQYEDFLHQHEAEKVVRILQRTWKKMSDAGRKAAEALTYSELGLTLLHKAIEK